MNKCENCKFYQAGVCFLPLWVDGKRCVNMATAPESCCDLHEALVTMEEE